MITTSAKILRAVYRSTVADYLVAQREPGINYALWCGRFKGLADTIIEELAVWEEQVEQPSTVPSAEKDTER